VGLIGDDISAVANASSKALDKPVIPVRCEGFRGVSQSLGTISPTTWCATGS
jgi:nitrogenase molybdenum-iron protein alpha chain